MVARFETCSDGELLARLGNEPEAFDVFYRRYETVVVAFLVRRTKDAHLAADLAAETFATVLLRADRFVDDGSPAIGWLLGIARHQLLNALRRNRTDARARRRLACDPTATHDAALERVEALADVQAAVPRVTRALERLPEDQRRAICAYVLDEEPYERVADILGVSEATVRKRVSRGLARMKTSLDGTP
ncbi:sigma-70 family RNA polymerase sigma factor [Patulibacter sp. NPDC049589]|uniref:RNA polymerase sigma factor n=1 Tax=Patulibacter sp. NPDC049589 TaxID=3154731 RepID=UPI00341D3062